MKAVQHLFVLLALAWSLERLWPKGCAATRHASPLLYSSISLMSEPVPFGPVTYDENGALCLSGTPLAPLACTIR
jgi:hypothetical protein